MKRSGSLELKLPESRLVRSKENVLPKTFLANVGF